MRAMLNGERCVHMSLWILWSIINGLILFVYLGNVTVFYLLLVNLDSFDWPIV